MYIDRRPPMDRKPTAEEHALFAMLRVIDGDDDTAADVLEELLDDFTRTELRGLAAACRRLAIECDRFQFQRVTSVATAVLAGAVIEAAIGTRP